MESNRQQIGLLSLLQESWLSWLLVMLPVSWLIELLGLPKIWLFVASALAIVPLAALLGEATDQLAQHVGPGIGGLLSATFGNATELIIALFALAAGLQEVVKASISGSIISNLLLVTGMSMFMGGLHREKQVFNRIRAGTSATMLFLAVAALVMPAVFDLAVFGSFTTTAVTVDLLSLLVALVLMGIYVASLIFSLKTHRDVITCAPLETALPQLRLPAAVALLLGATVLVAIEAELLVSAIAETTAALGLTEFFVGVVVVAIIGNVAEQYTAVLLARRNKMDLSFAITMGSSTQIALFIAPLLVFASFLLGNPMSLVFNPFELVAIALSVLLVSVVSLDGESNWFEGLQLIGVYAVLVIVFYFVPAA